MNHTDVAIGIVMDDGGRILIARRNADAELGGYWEFPGGKCQPDESPEQCVVRELAEETSLTVEPIHIFDIIEFSHARERVRLHPYLCHRIDGEASALAAAEVRWVTVEELDNYRFPPANDALIRELRQLLRTSSSDPAQS